MDTIDNSLTKLMNKISSTFEKGILKIIPYDVIIYIILPYLVYKCTKESDISIKSLFGYFETDGRRTKWLIWRGLCYNDTNKLPYSMQSKSFYYDPLEYICKDNIKKIISFPYLTSLILYNCNISELKEYPHLISLTIRYCNNISRLKEYPLLTSLNIRSCHNITKLEEYPYLNSLTLRSCHNIYELKEYPYLTLLTIRSCNNINELNEYPLLIYLNIRSCHNINKFKKYLLLASLTIRNCDNINKLKVYPLLTSLNILECKYLEDIKTKNKEEIQRYIQEYIK